MKASTKRCFQTGAQIERAHIAVVYLPSSMCCLAHGLRPDTVSEVTRGLEQNSHGTLLFHQPEHKCNCEIVLFHICSYQHCCTWTPANEELEVFEVTH